MSECRNPAEPWQIIAQEDNRLRQSGSVQDAEDCLLISSEARSVSFLLFLPRIFETRLLPLSKTTER
jgi:hypothetical protein